VQADLCIGRIVGANVCFQHLLPIYDGAVTKIPPDTMADKAAMLLSTDWFAPYWSVIGIEAENEKQCFQNGCRDIVRRLVGDAGDYYLIDFSEDRIEQTRKDLRLLARNCKLSKAAVIRVDDLAANKSGRDQLEKTAWLFRNLCDELLADGELDQQIKSVLERSRNKFSFANELKFEEMCLRSSTTWDTYVKSLTPELPASLAHLVSTGLLAIAELADVLRQLTTSQRATLHARFQVLATRLTGVELDRDWSGAGAES
jgi:hypothetical protein